LQGCNPGDEVNCWEEARLVLVPKKRAAFEVHCNISPCFDGPRFKLIPKPRVLDILWNGVSIYPPWW